MPPLPAQPPAGATGGGGAGYKRVPCSVCLSRGMWRGALLAPWLAAAAAFALEATPLAAGAPLSPDPSSSVCAFSAAYPRSYVAYRADEPPDLDGRVTGDKAWDTVAWTDPFDDISTETQPRLLTRAKIRWDDQFLYVGARLQEPDVWANLTEHDSVIFRDNDFEIFVDADQSTAYYKEFEVRGRESVALTARALMTPVCRRAVRLFCMKTTSACTISFLSEPLLQKLHAAVQLTCARLSDAASFASIR